MTDVHDLVGWAVVAVNAAVGAWGALAWWVGRDWPAFWPALRVAQALVLVQAVLGLVLLVDGRDLPRLHLVYGLTPIAVSFVAEQLRAVSAQTELERAGLAHAREMERLSEGEQLALVRAIQHREVGVMAASALVVAFLASRAAGLY